MSFDNILKHYGITGMKWGTRRVRVSSPEHSEAHGLRKKKKLHELSNEEIRKVATRLGLEKQYKDLNPSTIDRGSKAVEKIFSTIGKVSAAATTITAVAAGVKKALEVVEKHNLAKG